MKILIVDDSEHILAQLQLILKAAGYHDITTRHSAEEALRALGIQGRTDEILTADLILMDVQLEGMSGIEATKKIKKNFAFKDVPVIMITVDTSDDCLSAAFEAGAIDFLTKPINKVELLARVKSFLKLKQEIENRKHIKRELLDKNRQLELEISQRLKSDAEKKRLSLVEEKLRKENDLLRDSLADRYKFGNIVGKSQPMKEVYNIILQASSCEENVVIYGESGTGKELVAHSIHANSNRSGKPIVCVNCGAVPETLIESEFFGHKKGAFTGAHQDKKGFLDQADGGTLFLDEVGEISANMQIKLLRVIDGGGYSPIGGDEVKKIDIRIVAATNKDLKELVKKGTMREDFFYRLHIIPIFLPPLCERREDIPILAEHFLNKYDPEQRPELTGNILEALMNYHWPGNVRELENTLSRFVTLKRLDFMGLDLSSSQKKQRDFIALNLKKIDQPLRATVLEVEKEVIERTLQRHNWQKGKVASTLQIDPKTLAKKIKTFGIESP